MSPSLAGQLIGSIRRVWFATPDAANDAEPGTSTKPGALPRVAIEIETKSGRYAHLIAAPDSDALRLGTGPARLPAAVPARRHWTDLTSVLPVAFDGRPSIVALTPVERRHDEQDVAAALVWRIDLSNGAALLCSRSGADIEVRTLQP